MGLGGMLASRQITQGLTPKTPDTSIGQPVTLLQRKCACGDSPGLDDECTDCQSKRLRVHRRAVGSATPSDVPAIVHTVLGSSGQPLDAETRAYMERRFGHDF